MYFAGEDKRPGEWGWLIFFLGLVLTMISGVTGYLLIWNQRAFWAAKTILTVPVYLDELTAWIPQIGQNLTFGSMIAYIFLGGPAIGQATITRFYSLHFGISIILLLLMEIYVYRTRRERLKMSWFPLVLFFAMVLVVSWILPAEMGRRADGPRVGGRPPPPPPPPRPPRRDRVRRSRRRRPDAHPALLGGLRRGHLRLLRALGRRSRRLGRSASGAAAGLPRPGRGLPAEPGLRGLRRLRRGPRRRQGAPAHHLFRTHPRPGAPCAGSGLACA